MNVAPIGRRDRLLAYALLAAVLLGWAYLFAVLVGRWMT